MSASSVFKVTTIQEAVEILLVLYVLLDAQTVRTLDPVHHVYLDSITIQGYALSVQCLTIAIPANLRQPVYLASQDTSLTLPFVEDAP